MPSSDVRRVHLVAACGTAMGSLAGILKQKGFRVTGSDQNVYPPMSTQLEKLGVELMSGYRPENLAHKPDLVVIGNAIRRDNPEARAAIDGGMKYVSFTDALAEHFIGDKQALVVGGTHGKTTTTSILAQVLMASGADPSVFVGGVVANLGGSSFRIGSGPYVALEGDEYDTAFFDKTPKFWHYRVRHGIVTHVEYDHADIYPNVEAVEEAFRKFISLIPEQGSLTACASAPRLLKLLGAARCPVETYSAHVEADWTVQEVERGPDSTGFTAVRRGEAFGRFVLPMVGLHNVENTLAVIALTRRLGFSAAAIAAGLRGFEGVKRRMEIRGERRGVTVVDDFAHHPTAVKVTIDAARQKFKDRRLIAVFEPRTQTSRRRIFQKEYEAAFDGVAAAFVAKPFGSDTLAPEERFEPEELCAALIRSGLQAQALSSVDAIVDCVAAMATAGDVVLVMSNGGFGGIHDKLLDALARRSPTAAGAEGSQ